MASARSIRAGAAYVELLVSDSKLVRGLQRASARLNAFGAAIVGMGAKLAAAGAAMAAPLLAGAKTFSEVGDHLAKMSRRTGIAVEALSELAFAAELSGTTAQVLEAGVRKMQKSLIDAAGGSASAQEALAELGLTAEQLIGLTPEAQFKLLADRLSGIKDPTKAAALAMDLFGRAGTQLLPLMAEGAKGIEAMQQQARDLGLTLSKEDAAAAEQFNDTLSAMHRVLRNAAMAVGAALAPALTDVANRITALTVRTTAWIKQHRQMVVGALKIAAAVAGTGVALVGMGMIIKGIAGTFGIVSTVMVGVGKAVGVMGAALAAVLTPMGLIIAATAALGAYLIHASGLGGQALAWLSDRFGQLKEYALASFSGIADALAAGDIALAARVLWLSLKVAWQTGIGQLESLWAAATAALVKLAYGGYSGMLAAGEYLWHGMKVAWIEGVAFLKTLWTHFASWHAKAVEGLADAMVSAWIWAEEKTGKISKQEADQRRQYAKQQHDDQGTRIELERQAALNQAEQERSGGREAESRRSDQRLAEIGQRYQEIADAADAARAEKIAETESALAAARKEWQEAIGEAKRTREAGDVAAPAGGGMPDLKDYLAGLGEGIATAREKTIGVSGTFNAMEAAGLGAGSAADRIAKASEETAKNTRKLLDEMQLGGAVFE